MLEFACHTWAFNHLSLTEALGTIARLGFRYVDIGSGAHLNIARIAKDPRGVASEVRRDLDLFNLELSDLYIMLPRISLADEKKRQAEIDLYKSLLPFIVALEAPGVTLSPGLVHPATDEEALDRTISALREMMQASQLATPATQLHISIEPHVDSMAQKPNTINTMLAQVNDLQLTLDWAQLVYQDVFHDDIVSLLPRTRHIQIRQAARAQLQTPFAQGRIDVTKVVKSLKDAGYDGVISVEYMRTTSERHGIMEVDAITEVATMRDALRDARDEIY